MNAMRRWLVKVRTPLVRHQHSSSSSSPSSPSSPSASSSESRPTRTTTTATTLLVKQPHATIPPQTVYSAASTQQLGKADINYSRLMDMYRPLSIAHRSITPLTKHSLPFSLDSPTSSTRGESGKEATGGNQGNRVRVHGGPFKSQMPYEFAEIEVEEFNYETPRHAIIWFSAAGLQTETAQVPGSVLLALRNPYPPGPPGSERVARTMVNSLDRVGAGETSEKEGEVREMTSTKRKRKLKMNKHKYKKRRKDQEAMRKKLGK